MSLNTVFIACGEAASSSVQLRLGKLLFYEDILSPRSNTSRGFNPAVEKDEESGFGFSVFVRFELMRNVAELYFYCFIKFNGFHINMKVLYIFTGRFDRIFFSD